MEGSFTIGIRRVLGLSWDHQSSSRTAITLVALLSLLASLFLAVPPAGAAVPAVIYLDGTADLAAAGIEITAEYPAIDAVAARVPAGLDPADLPGVRAVYPDAAVQLQSLTRSTAPAGTSLDDVAAIIGAGTFHDAGITGSGIGIALIDSGIAPVPGLDGPDKVINGPDLSFESQDDALRYTDGFGHGTHLAGIIAGSGSTLTGIAPGAHLINVKVAGADGTVDVSQVLAAIDWVVQHRNDPGLDIRVLSLAFGTDSRQDRRLDPLSFAVEVAWNHGITVVVAGGNDTNDAPRLRNPATNPFVIAVGAVDTAGTVATRDDSIAWFSSCGTKDRHVDLVAPGTSILSARVPGSTADTGYPEAAAGDGLFRGTGTSQAAAVVAGAAALIAEQIPDASPDLIKALLTGSAAPIRKESSRCTGAGMVDLTDAFAARTPKRLQRHKASTGTGSLEAARGSFHVLDFAGNPLFGERDIFGNAFDAAAWSRLSAAAAAWSGGDWNGATWTGSDWAGTSWPAAAWSGSSWSGSSWSGSSWSGGSWSGSSWSGSSWSGIQWATTSWK